MSTIESKKVDVKASREEIFTFLTNLNNFIELLPKDKISDWKSDEASCSFKVQGGYKIGLLMGSAHPHEKIILNSSSDSPFKFVLNIHLEEFGSGTRGWQVCEADLNPFLRMMVEKPLKNLFDYIADKLQARYES
jgi:carbon monoxide dehydrogenase subunit G